MTDTETDAAAASDEPETPDEPKGPDEPDLDDDDFVEIPDDVAEQVAEADAEQDEEADDEPDETPEEEGDSPPSTPGADRTSLGDVYCNALGMATVAAKDRHGSDVEDRQAAMDEYADMARQLDLDEYVDDYVAMHGGPSELSPGQAIVVFSVVFGASVMVEDPELSESVLEGVGA
ncbi:hypothetical protein [Haloarchaeobius salinus]|uniref:hypothetical protein n=1 Tax=Haloarchaeobius salinus TaxID=1198298 RepID=UPI0021092E7B|nr:hypothetical protein [Haloarchaeobius salinus]